MTANTTPDGAAAPEISNQAVDTFTLQLGDDHYSIMWHNILPDGYWPADEHVWQWKSMLAGLLGYHESYEDGLKEADKAALQQMLGDELNENTYPDLLFMLVSQHLDSTGEAAREAGNQEAEGIANRALNGLQAPAELYAPARYYRNMLRIAVLLRHGFNNDNHDIVKHAHSLFPAHCKDNSVAKVEAVAGSDPVGDGGQIVATSNTIEKMGATVVIGGIQNFVRWDDLLPDPTDAFDVMPPWKEFCAEFADESQGLEPPQGTEEERGAILLMQRMLDRKRTAFLPLLMGLVYDHLNGTAEAAAAAGERRRRDIARGAMKDIARMDGDKPFNGEICRKIYHAAIRLRQADAADKDYLSEVVYMLTSGIAEMRIFVAELPCRENDGGALDPKYARILMRKKAPDVHGWSLVPWDSMTPKGEMEEFTKRLYAILLSDPRAITEWSAETNTIQEASAGSPGALIEFWTANSLGPRRIGRYAAGVCDLVARYVSSHLWSFGCINKLQDLLNWARDKAEKQPEEAIQLARDVYRDGVRMYMRNQGSRDDLFPLTPYIQDLWQAHRPKNDQDDSRPLTSVLHGSNAKLPLDPNRERETGYLAVTPGEELAQSPLPAQKNDREQLQKLGERLLDIGFEDLEEGIEAEAECANCAKEETAFLDGDDDGARLEDEYQRLRALESIDELRNIAERLQAQRMIDQGEMLQMQEELNKARSELFKAQEAADRYEQLYELARNQLYIAADISERMETAADAIEQMAPRADEMVSGAALAGLGEMMACTLRYRAEQLSSLG